MFTLICFCNASLTTLQVGAHCDFFFNFYIFLFSARDLTDNEELSFYEQCLTNLDVDLHSSLSLPWASLADVGDTITEFSLNVSMEHLKRYQHFFLSCLIFIWHFSFGCFFYFMYLFTILRKNAVLNYWFDYQPMCFVILLSCIDSQRPDIKILFLKRAEVSK